MKSTIKVATVHINTVSYDDNNAWGAKYPIAVTSSVIFKTRKVNKIYFEFTDQFATPNNIKPNTDVTLYLTTTDYFDKEGVLHVAEYQYA